MIKKVIYKELSELSFAEAKKELNWLSKELEKHNRAYHQDDNPLITESEYDVLYQRNENLEMLYPHLVHANSFSSRIGAPAKDGFSKVEHEKPMLSLSLTTNQVGKMARTLLPWFTAGKSLKITISIDKVIAQDDPNDQSEKNYLSTTTGLTL